MMYLHCVVGPRKVGRPVAAVFSQTMKTSKVGSDLTKSSRFIFHVPRFCRKRFHHWRYYRPRPDGLNIHFLGKSEGLTLYLAHSETMGLLLRSSCGILNKHLEGHISGALQ